jgi:hypothetical protein
MYINKLKIASLVAICGSFVFTQISMADIAIIANTSNSSSVTVKEVKKIFLGKNDTMTPVDLSEGNATRNAFYEKVVSKNEAQMKAYWSKMIFSGKATPPESKSDDAGVKVWVASNQKGIGYIDSGSVDDSVKVLLTIK